MSPSETARDDRDRRELADALALDRLIYGRGGDEWVELPDGAGIVVRNAALPEIHIVNCVRLTAPIAPALDDPGAIAALAERRLGDRGHRRVVIEDEAAAERLAPAMIDRGWSRERTVLMVLRTDPARALPDPRAREISEDELRSLNLAANRHTDYGADVEPELPQRLVDTMALLRERTPALCFGAGEDGELQSMCTLFCAPDLNGRRAAMVESVATLPDHRERGLAKAAVGAALRAAADWGADLIAVPADADDWPQLLYASLGFVAAGRLLTFLRTGPDPT